MFGHQQVEERGRLETVKDCGHRVRRINPAEQILKRGAVLKIGIGQQPLIGELDILGGDGGAIVESCAFAQRSRPDRAFGIALPFGGQPGDLRAIRRDIKKLVVNTAVDLAFHTPGNQLRVLGAQIIAARPDDLADRGAAAGGNPLAGAEQLGEDGQT